VARYARNWSDGEMEYWSNAYIGKLAKVVNTSVWDLFY
jgi:hypothetical protein